MSSFYVSYLFGNTFQLLGDSLNIGMKIHENNKRQKKTLGFVRLFSFGSDNLSLSLHS